MKKIKKKKKKTSKNMTSTSTMQGKMLFENKIKKKNS